MSWLARILCTIFTGISALLFVQYKLGAWDVQRLLSRPQGAAGPTLVHGVARGEPVNISSGERALLASIDLWDRNPNRKGAKLLCSWLEGGAFEVEGQTVALEPERRRYNRLGQWPRGQPGSLLFGLPQSVDSKPTLEMLRRCPGATVARVSRLWPTDPVTVLGCKKGDTIAACEDGTDMVLGYPIDETKKRLLDDGLVKLIFAVFSGFPPLVYLIVAMYQGAPSLERRTPANREVS